MRAVIGIALVLSFGCLEPTNGTGRVEGDIAVPGCRRSGDRPQGAYSFDAGRVATMRFENTLQIIMQEHAVDLEEIDGLVIQLYDLEAIWQTHTARPFELSVSGSVPDPAASLNLFETCPLRPTLRAISGRLVLDKFNIAADPEDTGVNEAVAGTLTATVVGIDGMTIAGTIRADFDFVPAKRAVSGPQ